MVWMWFCIISLSFSKINNFALLLIVFIVLAAALFLFRNGAEGVATQRRGRFAALGESVLASAMGSEMRQGGGVGV